MAKRTAPEIVSLNSTQVEELLVKLAPLLPAETFGLLEKVLRTLQWLMGAIEAKDTTIGRLARMIFGAKTEKTARLFPQPPPAGSQKAAAATPAPKRKGHGRTAAADYPGAKRVKVPHPQLRPGDPCPDCKQGKLYRLKRPAQIVRITAQSLFAATRFELEKLRCKLCGKTFTVAVPLSPITKPLPDQPHPPLDDGQGDHGGAGGPGDGEQLRIDCDDDEASARLHGGRGIEV